MVNKIILVGRAGKEPTLHTTQSGKKVVKFTLATWESFKDEKEESGWRQVTEWHNCVVWGESAETLSKKVKKGDMIYMEGKVTTRSYEDKDGVTKYITEVIGFAKAILPKKEGEASKAKSESVKTDKQPDDTVDIHEEIPPDELSELPY
jgi:single-strand DNA-binding protein